MSILSRSKRTISKEKAIGFLLPLLLAAVFMLFNQYKYRNLYGDLDDFGRETMATIFDKRIVRYGTDRPGHYYQMIVGFTVGDKMLRAHVQVTSDFYQNHEAPERVSIRYLPDNPLVREIDPDLRTQLNRRSHVIVLIFVCIAFVNLFFIGDNKKKTSES